VRVEDDDAAAVDDDDDAEVNEINDVEVDTAAALNNKFALSVEAASASALAVAQLPSGAS